MAEAHLALCSGGMSELPRQSLRLEDGRTLGIYAAAARVPQGCTSVAVNVDAGAVRGLAARQGVPGFEVGNVVLVGPEGEADAGSFRIEVEGSQAAPATLPPSLPVGSALLPRLAVRAFGVEERMHVTRTDEHVEIACGAGESPAGILLDPGSARLPREVLARLVARGSGDPGFQLAVVSRGDDAPAEAGSLLESQSGRRAIIPAEAWPQGEEPVQFVVSCPNDAARLLLDGLVIEPLPEPRPIPRSGWMWESARWRDRPSELLDEASAHRLETLFIALQIEEERLLDADRLSSFVQKAAARGISVVAVEGDPAMVLDEGRAQALARARAIARYQSQVDDDARLAGVQYDIEPYLLPAFQSARAVVLTGWRQTVDELAAAHGQKVDLVLPFWIADAPDARSLLLEGLERSVGRITIMAYRTEADAVTSISEPLLAWGSKNDVPVRIGLEAGPVPDETHLRYRPAREGELRLFSIDDVLAAMLLDRARPGPRGITFRLEHETIIPGSRTSFLGDRERMMEVAQEAEPALAAWTSFAGLAFHGLLQN